MSRGIRPLTLTKISDLVSNLRPIYPTAGQESTHDLKQDQNISPDSQLRSALSKECLFFNHKDLVAPDFKHLTGRWRLRLANHIDFYKPYDTVEWIDRTDRFECKLRNKAAAQPDEESVFVCNGKLRQRDETNAFEEVFDGRRAQEAILFTDYTDLMLIYSCKQSPDHNGVSDNLKLLIRKRSARLGMEVKDLVALASSKLLPRVLTKINRLLDNLKYVYNETTARDSATPVTAGPHGVGLPGSDHPIQEVTQHIGSDLAATHPTPILHDIIDTNTPLMDKNVPLPLHDSGRRPELDDPNHPLPEHSLDPHLQVTELPIPVPVVNVTAPEDTCPDLDGIAQKNIDFRRFSGRWDAIMSSNKKWDNECIYTVDNYDKNTDSLIQMKHTGGKKHKVVIKHKTAARQATIVDDVVFESWILDTDYRTYRLAHTCYVKHVNGKSKRIDLQRLYTRGVEAKQLDEQVLRRLTDISAKAGKHLELIDRQKCVNIKPVRYGFNSS